MFVPIILQISWIFQRIPNFLYFDDYLMIMKEVMAKNQKIKKSENMPIWANPEI